MSFCRIYSLFFLLYSFPSLCYFTFSSLPFPALVAIILPFMAIVPIYIGLTLWDFPLLPLWLTNHFCLVAQPPLHLGMPSTFSPFHYSLHNNLQFIWFYCEPFLLPWTDKAVGLSLPTSLACIK